MHIEPVRLGLARDASPDARQCLAPRFGDRLVALLTGEKALSRREPAPRPFDSAVDRRVDLILHGAVLCPTDRHGRNIGQERTVSRRRRSGGLLRGVQSGLSCPMSALGEPSAAALDAEPDFAMRSRDFAVRGLQVFARAAMSGTSTTLFGAPESTHRIIALPTSFSVSAGKNSAMTGRSGSITR